MKRIALLLAGVFLTGVFNASSRADIYIVHRVGANIVPAKSADISMDAEDVRIEPQESGYHVTATFVMHNHAVRQVDSLVAFPILGSTLGRPSNLDQDFQVHIKDRDEPDGAYQRVIAQIQPGRARADQDASSPTNPPKVVGDYPEAVAWNVTWQPGQTKIIRVGFDMGEPMYLPGSNRLVQGWQWTYIVTTGSLWKGPIGRADISIRFTTPSMKGWPPLCNYRQVSYPDHAQWNGNELVAWHFENWTPTGEIWVRTVDWQGLMEKDVSRYRFNLPVYRGAEREYDKKTVEDLVNRDLHLATEHRLAEVQAFDRNLLRIAIADWLLHEIYARHGDSFYLGKESPSFPFGEHMAGDGEGNLYSFWWVQFGDYSYRGGWYQPREHPAGPVKITELDPMEQKNVRFLRAYLDRLGRDPKYQALRASAHIPGAE
jgi:hypothetical protein